ncbi:MAG: FHA domain-containing protein, partial [Anaerolineae bacterium]|nr:FHA domain-containing protein [Anaerolineae bacterium]
LSEYVVELASQAGCKLINTPIIDMQEEPSLGSSQFIIKAEHSGIRRSTTALMERIAIPASSAQSHNPQMVINGQRAIQIEGDIVNIGRSRDNHIVIEDASVSRYHLQLRLRHGRYMLFDTQSQSGTFVNDVAVKQHVLQNSDVIRIGNTHIVYTEDTPPGETTGIFPVIDPDQPEPLD